MKDKYFTPEISDIRVGYECEILYAHNMIDYNEKLTENVWEKFTFELTEIYGQDNCLCLDYRIRTPYLTKEQIEAEGWKHHQNNRQSINAISYLFKIETLFSCSLYSNGIRLFSKWKFSVGRGSTWGNPFRVVEYSNGDYAIKTDGTDYCNDILIKHCHALYKKKEDAVMDAIKCYDYYLLPYKHGSSMMQFYQSMSEMEEVIMKLKGKNLTCWCPIHENNLYHHCHADLLLSIANKIPFKEVIERNISTWKK